MTQSTIKCSLDDLICVWLDEAISNLEMLDFLRWAGEGDISIPEAARAQLFFAVKQALLDPSHLELAQRKILKFPTSVISRVNSAISHLNRQKFDIHKNERHVIFMPTSLAQLAQQTPIAKALFENGRTSAFLFPTSRWAENVDLNGLDVIPHGRYLQNEMLSARLRARVMWLRLGREESVRLPEFSYAQKSYDLSRIALSTIAGSLNAVFEAYSLAKYVVRSANPKLIVLGNDLSPHGRTIMAHAKREQIKSVGILSHVSDTPIESFRPSDKIVVFGNYAKRVLSSCGIDNRKIKACGSPYLDSVEALSSPQFLKPLVHNPNKTRLFLLADLGGKWERRLRTVAHKTQSHFYLLLLDSTKSKDTDAKTGQKLENFQICLKQDLSTSKFAECIRMADFVLASRFSTAIEAMSLGKRVIAIDFDGAFDNREFIKSGIVDVAYDEQSLLSILNRKPAQEDEKTPHVINCLEDYFHRRDGQASQRIARVLVEESQR